jgi:glycosyltransferase involved in cell wall biosynthesis
MTKADGTVTLCHVITVPESLAFLRGQVGHMAARGFEVHAVSSPGPALDAFGEDEAVATAAVDMARAVTPARDLRALRDLVGHLRRIRPHIVHAHTPKGGLLGMLAARLTRTPVRIYHIRGLPYMTATGRRRTLLRTTERISCRLADRVFCVSHSIRRVAVEDGICPAEKIVVFGGGSGNGVDAEGRFDPDRWPATHRDEQRAALGIGPDDPVVAFVGRVVRDKGVPELHRAWTEVREAHPRAHLVLAGAIEPQDPVDPEVLHDLRIDPRAHLLGSVDDVAALYPAADVVVLPTHREGFPNVPLEAASMGLPVVATRIPGCTDAVADGETGLLVPVGDPAALAEALDTYLADPATARRHGQAGRARVLREFRRQDIWNGVHDAYLDLLAHAGIAPPRPVERTAAP